MLRKIHRARSARASGLTKGIGVSTLTIRRDL
ncbi:hypothetical protein [Catenulispora pinisilvae]